MSDEIKVNDSASNAPEDIRRWAKKLTDRQDCSGVLSREASGYHLYLPCPDCLHTHGRRELDDPKYSINLSMLSGHGDANRESNKEASWMPGTFQQNDDLEKKRQFRSGICMRTRSARNPHRFSIDDLLNMATVTERHPDILTSSAVRGQVGSAEKEEMWEEDPVSGGLAPPPPGEMVDLTSLPVNHPAMQYLVRRGFDPHVITDQFRLAFCTKEYPYGQKKIYYRKMPGNWKDTPQHRIIFHSLIDGVPLTWQARVLEKVSEDGLNKFMLHPYAGGFYHTRRLGSALKSFKAEGHVGDPDVTWDESRGGYWIHMWSYTHTRANPKSDWIPVAPYDEKRNGSYQFQPSKYRTAKYSSRQMMGWDAAIQRAEEDTEAIKWCVLLEGPLDGGRAGPGGIPLIGSSLSPDNAAKVASNFHVVFTGFDADKAGREATEKVTKTLYEARCRAPILNMVLPLPIPDDRDVGDLTTEEYTSIFEKTLKRSRR